MLFDVYHPYHQHSKFITELVFCIKQGKRDPLHLQGILHKT